MTVNYEIKSQLAKLLATEDLVVENRDVDTAQFNVGTRVLTLPLWKRASNTVYDLLVGHEVGHALFTPDEDWTKKIKVPQQFVNVCEDARIEKLMKRKYPGLAKTFYEGYNELNEQDFFELDGEDINNFNLADRANLHFKSCSIISISFSSVEKQIVDLIGAAETFDDTLNAAKVLYEYCVEKQKEQEQEKREEEGIQQELDLSSGEKDLDEMTDQELLEESDKEPQKESTSSEDPAQLDVPSFEQPKVQTDDLLNEKLSEFNDNRRGVENIYCEVPKIDVDKIIISHDDIHEDLDEYFRVLEHSADFRSVDERYYSFKKSAQKEVGYLVKEFECRKAADNYARSSTGRTGVLDTKKLHQYKFSEDIFRRINVVPDGKNHGLIFILDWSGSMNSCLLATLKQLYNLVWFCQKVQIPFEVYAFSNTYYQRDGYSVRMEDLPKSVEPKENDFSIDRDFCLMNFLSSKSNKASLEKELINIWRVVSCLDYGSRWEAGYNIPNKYRLGGTPLNETIVSLHQIIPQFKKETGIQKVQCVILTDGEAGQLPVYKPYTDYRDDEVRLGTRHWNPENSYLRNRKTGHVYKLSYEYYKFTEVLLSDLKQMHPDVNFIGIRLLSSRDFNGFLRRYEYVSDDVLKKARKNKSYAIKGCGYDSYFGIMSSALDNDSDFEVEEDASKAQIKRAFVKSLQAKKLNKKVLGEFIELVA